MIGRVRVPATMAVVVVMVGLAVPAHASEFSSACLVQGEAKTDPSIQLLGGSGSYTFSSLSFVCTGVTNGSPTVVVLGMSSTGAYASAVCGTGTMTSQPGQTQLHDVSVIAGSVSSSDYAAVVADIGYEIDLIATAGVLRWTDGADGSGGAVLLSPPTTKAEITEPPDCTKAFTLEGAVRLAKGRCFDNAIAPMRDGAEIVAPNDYWCTTSQLSIASCAVLEMQQGTWVTVSKGCKNDVNTDTAPSEARGPCITGVYRTQGTGSAVWDGVTESSKTSLPIHIPC